MARVTRRYTRLSNDDWKIVLNLYQTGINTVDELADRYEVSTSSIMQKVRGAGVTRRASFTAKAGIATASGAVATLPPISDPGTVEGRIRDTNDAAYLGAMAIHRMLEQAMAAFSTPTSPVEAAATIRALDQAAVVLERINKVRRTVLRLDRENQHSDAILPELPIREMTVAEYEAIRAEQAREDRLAGPGRLDRDLDTLADELTPVEDDRHSEGDDE